MNSKKQRLANFFSNDCYHGRIPSYRATVLAVAVAAGCLTVSPSTVLAADIVGTPPTPVIIDSDHSNDVAYGVKKTDNNAEGGVVEVRTNGKISSAAGGYSENSNTKDNQVNVSGGEVLVLVFGGASENGVVESNRVNISSGKTNTVMGGFSNNDSVNNQVSVDGGMVTGTLIGGAGSTVRDNKVNISGGTFNGAAIIAGYGEIIIANNHLTISGGSFSDTVTLHGYGADNIINVTTGGNTINLKISGLTIENIGGTDNLHFYLPNHVQNGDTVVTLKNVDAGMDARQTNIGVCATADSALNDGDSITLINAQSLSTFNNAVPNFTDNMTQADCSPDYQFTLEKVDNKLIARVTKTAIPNGRLFMSSFEDGE